MKIDGVIDRLDIKVDYVKDSVTIHAPYPIKVVQVQTSSTLDGITVIFERHRTGEF